MQIYRLHNLYNFFLTLSISSTPAQVPLTTEHEVPIKNTCSGAKKGSEIYTNFTSCTSRVPLPPTPALPSPTPPLRLPVTMTVEANTSQCKLGFSLCQGAEPSSLTIRPLFILSKNLAFFLILSGDI